VVVPPGRDEERVIVRLVQRVCRLDLSCPNPTAVSCGVVD